MIESNKFAVDDHFFNINKKVSEIRDTDYDIKIPSPEEPLVEDFLWEEVDGRCFLDGICHIFAQALYDSFKSNGYVMKKAQDETHIFCIKDYKNKRYYIDVRGATSDERAFFSGRYSSIDIDKIEDYEGWNTNKEEPQELYGFAKAIIDDVKYNNLYRV